MFTGLIEDLGTVKSVTPSQIKIESALSDIKTGDSVAVNGVCLTSTGRQGGVYTFDVSPQTMRVSALSTLKPGSKVNLERALQLSSRLGGHIVSGHVDYLGEVLHVAREGGFLKITFSIERGHAKYFADKGSAAVDGVSLTTARAGQDSFDIFVIPETIKNTIISSYKPGSKVNIETDILAKYAERLLRPETKINEDFLKENGFL